MPAETELGIPGLDTQGLNPDQSLQWEAGRSQSGGGDPEVGPGLGRGLASSLTCSPLLCFLGLPRTRQPACFIPLLLGVPWRAWGSQGPCSELTTPAPPLGAIMSTAEGSPGCQAGPLRVHSAPAQPQAWPLVPSGLEPRTLTSYHLAWWVLSQLNPPLASRTLSQRQLEMGELTP